MLHNAGRSQRARWEHTDIEVDLDLFNLNVFSIVNLSRCIMPHFLERNSGTFALMSSAAGKAGVPFSGSYTGSKHALHVRNFLMPYTVLGLHFVTFHFRVRFIERTLLRAHALLSARFIECTLY